MADSQAAHPTQTLRSLHVTTEVNQDLTTPNELPITSTNQTNHTQKDEKKGKNNEEAMPETCIMPLLHNHCKKNERVRAPARNAIGRNLQAVGDFS